MKKIFIVILSLVMITGLSLSISAATQTNTYHYNLQDFGGRWTEDSGHQVDIIEDTVFDIGEITLQKTHYLNYSDVTCQHPNLSLNTGEFITKADEGDYVEFDITFPEYNGNLPLTDINITVTGVKKDDGLKRKLDINYDIQKNSITVKTSDTSNVISYFRFYELITDCEYQEKYDNSNNIIGLKISGVLTTKIDYFWLAPMFYSDNNVSYMDTSISFSSYDDIQFTLVKEEEIIDPPDNYYIKENGIYKVQDDKDYYFGLYKWDDTKKITEDQPYVLLVYNTYTDDGDYAVYASDKQFKLSSDGKYIVIDDDQYFDQWYLSWDLMDYQGVAKGIPLDIYEVVAGTQDILNNEGTGAYIDIDKVGIMSFQSPPLQTPTIAGEAEESDFPIMMMIPIIGLACLIIFVVLRIGCKTSGKAS